MHEFLKFWGVDQAVFARPVPSERLFLPPRLKAQLDRLALACSQDQPLVVVTGEPGSGKSTVLKWLFRKLDPSTHDVLLTTLVRKERSGGWLAPRLAELMGLAQELTSPAMAGKTLDTADVIRAVAARLDELLAEKRKLVVAVDAAHCAETPAAFDEIVALLNLQALAGHCLSFVLCGADSLLEVLDQTPELATRLAFHVDLQRLSRDETGLYLLHRLREAGLGEIFEPDAVDFLHMKARGVFAALDTCADACLMEAFQRGLRRVTLDCAKAATGYLGQRDLVEAQRRPPVLPRALETKTALIDAETPAPLPHPVPPAPPSPSSRQPAPAAADAAKPASSAAAGESASIKLSSLFKSDPGTGRGRP